MASEAELEAFSSQPVAQRQLTEPLRGVLFETAVTGRIRYSWTLVRPVVEYVMQQVRGRAAPAGAARQRTCWLRCLACAGLRARIRWAMCVRVCLMRGAAAVRFCRMRVPPARACRAACTQRACRRAPAHPDAPAPAPAAQTLREYEAAQAAELGDGPARPAIGDESLGDTVSRFRTCLARFNKAPWTLQRLCEVLLNPKRQYKQLHKVGAGADTAARATPASTPLVCRTRAAVHCGAITRALRWTAAPTHATPLNTPSPLHPPRSWRWPLRSA